MRIVLDTNVVVSALLWRGTPYRLLDRLLAADAARLFCSVTLLDELADVLARPFASRRLAAIGKTAQSVLADYISAVEWVEPSSVPRVVHSDADDDHVVAAAVAARAMWIVSGDADLLKIGHHQGIDILSAALAFERLRTQATS